MCKPADKAVVIKFDKEVPNAEMSEVFLGLGNSQNFSQEHKSRIGLHQRWGSPQALQDMSITRYLTYATQQLTLRHSVTSARGKYIFITG